MGVESEKRIVMMKDAQELVRQFAAQRGWEDIPSVDKFDHLHEELVEMSQHLRYKSREERIQYVAEHRDIFMDGIGDLFFGLCRLANQLGVDIEEAFHSVKEEIFRKYSKEGSEHTVIRHSQGAAE